MSIRHLALELYRAQREVDRLEKERTAAPPARHMLLDDQIHEARTALQQLRRMLDGAKENASTKPSLNRRN